MNKLKISPSGLQTRDFTQYLVVQANTEIALDALTNLDHPRRDHAGYCQGSDRLSG